VSGVGSIFHIGERKKGLPFLKVNRKTGGRKACQFRERYRLGWNLAVGDLQNNFAGEKTTTIAIIPVSLNNASEKRRARRFTGKAVLKKAGEKKKPKGAKVTSSARRGAEG